jgi:hypothetical protein
LKIIFERTPESDRLLRDVAIVYAGKKARELMCRNDFVRLCKENAEICLAMFRESLSVSSAAAQVALTPLRGTCPQGDLLQGNYVAVKQQTQWWCFHCSKGFNEFR